MAKDYKVETIQANTVEDLDEKILDLISKGYANAGDLVVVPNQFGSKLYPYTFFQTFVWYPEEDHVVQAHE